MNRSDEELRRWANEHLVYEAGMLVHAFQRTADKSLSDQDRNAFIESFAIHVRCLREFLWGGKRYKPQDARASDFCASDVWEHARPPLPEALKAIEGEHNRIGREIVHLTYPRLDLDAEAKAWDMSALLRDIGEALSRFSEVAKPERLAEKTRHALALMPTTVMETLPLLTRRDAGLTNTSHLSQPTRITGGTIPFPGHSADEIA